MRLRHFFYVLIWVLALAIQGPLWISKGGVIRMQSMEGELASIRAANEKLRAENEVRAAEIESLESGSGAVEERARMRLGMIRNDEVLFRLVPLGEKAADPLIIETHPGKKPRMFEPKRSNLYTDGDVLPKTPGKDGKK